MKIRSKAAHVAEVNGKKCEGLSRHLGSIPEKLFDLETFMVSSPEGDLEAGVDVALFN